jgi:hypothetical protein
MVQLTVFPLIFLLVMVQSPPFWTSRGTRSSFVRHWVRVCGGTVTGMFGMLTEVVISHLPGCMFIDSPAKQGETIMQTNSAVRIPVFIGVGTSIV